MSDFSAPLYAGSPLVWVPPAVAILGKAVGNPAPALVRKLRIREKAIPIATGAAVGAAAYLGASRAMQRYAPSGVAWDVALTALYVTAAAAAPLVVPQRFKTPAYAAAGSALYPVWRQLGRSFGVVSE